MSPRHLTWLAALALTACGGSETASDVTPDEPSEATADAGTTPLGPAIPLVSWVDGLVEDTTDQAEPDTVDDKNIENTEDPTAFDHLLR